MCGLYGFVYYGKKELKGAEKLLENLALEAMERGIDATGYAFVHKGKIQIDKAPKAAYQMKYSLPKNVHKVMQNLTIIITRLKANKVELSLPLHIMAL